MAGLIVGIAGLGISAGTTAASFIQAGQEKRKQRQYEADADKAMQEARRQLQINYAKQMSIKKEPYNLERLGVRAAGQGIINAATESDRGAAAAAGQVMMATQAGEADITNRQTDELYNIENAILEEESRLRDINVDLDMQEVEGNMAAAADARMLSQQATQAGIQGVASTAQAGLSMVPLYQGNKNATNAAIAKVQAADPTYLAGYNPATATGSQYRQMKRANPLWAQSKNYQEALAGLPITGPFPFDVIRQDLGGKTLGPTGSAFDQANTNMNNQNYTSQQIDAYNRQKAQMMAQQGMNPFIIN
jgi:hypothetical protein